jgi:hypothetical protein
MTQDNPKNKRSADSTIKNLPSYEAAKHDAVTGNVNEDEAKKILMSLGIHGLRHAAGYTPKRMNEPLDVPMPVKVWSDARTPSLPLVWPQYFHEHYYIAQSDARRIWRIMQSLDFVHWAYVANRYWNKLPYLDERKQATWNFYYHYKLIDKRVIYTPLRGSELYQLISDNLLSEHKLWLNNNKEQAAKIGLIEQWKWLWHDQHAKWLHRWTRA